MARTSFKKQFRIHGIRLRASVHQNKDGAWKIFSVGAVDMPTALLPFEVQQRAMELVRAAPFATENQAKAALLDAA
jgi:hypothetical protein